MKTISIPIKIKGEYVFPIKVTDDFTESNTKIANFSLNSSFQCTPSFTIAPSFTIPMTHDMSLNNYVVNKVSYTLVSYATTANCWGISKSSSFYIDNISTPNANPIRVGNYNGNPTKAWIPFLIDFGSPQGGIRIVSATLSLNLFEPTVIPVSSKQCKIKYGVEKVINPADPNSWKTLGSRIMSTSFGTYTVAEDLAQGYSHDFDLTNLLNDVLGSSGGITWNNGEKLAIILTDFGSYINEHLAFTSNSGQVNNPDFTMPKLTIVYEDIYYGFNMRSAWISSSKPNNCNPTSKQMFVGEPNNGSGKNRSLLFIDLSAIPTSATVTSATLQLYLESRQSSAATTLQLYKLLSDKNWDLNTASWNKRFGTQVWTTAGALSDCDSTPVSTLSLLKTEALGYKSFDLTSLVQAWVSTPSQNKGILLKTSIENNDGYTFSSRLSSKAETQKPKLIITYTYGGTTYSNVEIS